MPGVLQAVAAGTGVMSLIGGGLWYASAWPESQLFGRVLVAGNDPREVALTFDDGPNDAATPRLLDVLARHGVHATFFAIGDFVRKQPQLARRVLEEGHVLGNHTMTHPKLSLQPASRIRQELTDCNAVIEDVTGAAVRYFRPPYGARRPLVIRAAMELGLTTVQWNVTGYDWNAIGVDGILDNVEFGVARNLRRRRGSNVLLHDGGHFGMGAARMDTARAVDCFLSTPREAAFSLVTVDAWEGSRARAVRKAS